VTPLSWEISLKTLYVMDPLDRIQVDGDSTYMMMLENQRRGWPVWMCTPSELFADRGIGMARARAVAVRQSAPHFVPCSDEVVELGAFDVIWMRKDPPFDMHYVFATYLLDLVPSSTLVLNDPAALRNCNEKMFALQWPHLGPPTLVTRRIDQARDWIRSAPGRVVLKPWDGNGGRGVLVAEPGDPNLRSMLEILTEEEKVHILVQHYIPEIAEGDKRIILIDGKPVGWMLRVPQPGDHRGNMHVGATVQACDLSDRDREICDAIASELKNRGMLFVGIDTIGPYMTEINVTSPTGIQEINALMGLQLERDLTDAVAACLAAHRGEAAPQGARP